MHRRIAGILAGAAVTAAALLVVAGPMSLAASAAPSYVIKPPAIAASATVVRPGTPIVVSGINFGVSEFVTIYIDGSDEIGTTMTTTSQTFSTGVTIPSNIKLGQHVITATDVGHTESVDIEVVSTTTPTSPTSGGTLPLTGANVELTAGTGAGIIAVGGLLVLGVRRRRRSAWTE